MQKMDELLNDLLECSVCLERLDTSSKVLPCQHTFCRKCLEVIVSSRHELRCPECRILVDIKIDDLPPNVLLMRILEGMKNAAVAQKTQQQHQNHSSTPTIQNDKQQGRNDHQTQNQQQQQQHLQHHQQQQIKHKQQNTLVQQQPQQNTHTQQQQPQQSTHAQHQQAQQNAHSQQQQTQHHQVPTLSNNVLPTTTSSTMTAAAATIATTATAPTPTNTTTMNAQQQQRRCLLPHAYALFDFDSNEPTDLHFKKGDLILLKRKIDHNWLVGQLNGKEGTFPVNYVQVIVPLPLSQCIALYDFKMGPNEEEGCLSFKKGAVIHVLRRVDQNWAEGRIGTNIGIFPIAFVELNALANQLLNSREYATHTASETATAGPTQPTSIAMQTTSATQNSSTILQHVPPMPQLDIVGAGASNDCSTSTSSSPITSTSLSPSSSTSNTATTSPSAANTSASASGATTNSNSSSTSSTCSSNANSMANSPHQSQSNTPQHVPLQSGSSSVRYRDCKRQKRHSLNALFGNGGNANSNSGNGGATTNSYAIIQSNRHSAEILSMPSSATSSDAAQTQCNAQQSQQEPQQAQQKGQPLTPPPLSNNSSSSSTTHSRVNVLKTVGAQNIPPSLPWGYLALYPYKPRKSDELELKKGCVYIVTERCLDGWFKGKNWQDISGVFPGNYVTPLRNRDQQQLMHQWKFVPFQQQHQQQQQQQQSTQQHQQHQQHQQQSINMPVNSSGGTQVQQVSNVLPHQLPDLPPRQQLSNALASVWTKPLGHTVEAFFNRGSGSSNAISNHINTTTTNVNNEQQSLNKRETKEKENKQKEIAASNSSCGASTAVSLMKRLTSIKSRSKSPAAHNSTQQRIPKHQHNQHSATVTTTYDDSTTSSNLLPTHQGQLHPVHVRSGSCPSQLLQNLPMDLNAGVQLTEHRGSQQTILNTSQQHHHQQQQNNQQIDYGSQRIKSSNGSKQRPQLLQNGRQSIDGGTFRGGLYNYNQATSPTPQSKDLQQQQQQLQQMQLIANLHHNHRKTQSLDANAILSAPTSVHGAATSCVATFGGCLGGNGGAATISTQSCNINTAAIIASATTKSTQNTRESRFRCVVPYPPNSDIELELHIGDIIYVHRKQKNGWYKGTHARTNKTGLFPASFVEPDL